MKKLFTKDNCCLLLCLVVLIFITACTAGKETTTADSVAVNPIYVHTVKWPNETMAKIALWYTGKTDNWIEISRLNRNCDPSRLKKKCRIKIPRNLLVKFEPMPKKFAASCLRKKKKHSCSKKTSTTQHVAAGENQADDLLLFGPK